MSTKKIRNHIKNQLSNWKCSKPQQTHSEAKKIIDEWTKEPYLYIKNQPPCIHEYDTLLTQMARTYMIWIDKTAAKSPTVLTESEKFRTYARYILDQFDPEFCKIKIKKPTKIVRCQKSLNIIDVNDRLVDNVDDKKLNEKLLEDAKLEYECYCDIVGTVMTALYNECQIVDADVAFIKMSVINMYKSKNLDSSLSHYDTMGGLMVGVLLYIFEDIMLFTAKIEKLTSLKLYMAQNNVDLKTMMAMETFEEEYPGISNHLKKMSIITAIAKCKSIIHDNYSLYKILMRIVSDVQPKVNKLYAPDIIDTYMSHPKYLENVDMISSGYKEYQKKRNKNKNSTSYMTTLCSFILSVI